MNQENLVFFFKKLIICVLSYCDEYHLELGYLGA